MNINKKMKKFAKILAASLVITSFCPTVSGLPVQVNSSVEVQAAVKAKAPSCVAKQTVYVVASFGGPNVGDEPKNIFGLPDCYIFIKNLSPNAKITNIKSSNKNIKATKREGMNALELSMANPSQCQKNLVGAASTISFRVTQNGKTYKLSCRINIAERKSPFAKFTVGSEDYAQYFNGYMYVNASELPATDFCEQKSMGASGRPLSCTAGRYCRNKTDPGCGITQGVICGFAVHLAFTWVCRQNPKLSSKQRPEPVPIGR